MALEAMTELMAHRREETRKGVSPDAILRTFDAVALDPAG